MGNINAISFRPQAITVVYKFVGKEFLVHATARPNTEFVTFFGASDSPVTHITAESIMSTTRHDLSPLEIDSLSEILPSCRAFTTSTLTSEAIEKLSNDLEKFIKNEGEILFVFTEKNGYLNLIDKSRKEALGLIKSFFENYLNSAREARIYLIDFRYLQVDKIEGLYAQVVDRVETSSEKELTSKKTKGLSSKLSLGKLLSFLGIDVGTDLQLNYENVTSKRVNYELSPVQKFMIIYEILTKTKQLSYLNHDLQNDNRPKQFVRFEGQMRYSSMTGYEKYSNIINSLFKNDERDVLTRTPLKFCLDINKYKIEFVCFGGFFKMSPNSPIPLVLSKKKFEIKGLASIIDIDLKKKQLVLSPIALW